MSEKPKRGNCATCHWFEWNGVLPTDGQPRGGQCMVHPPSAIGAPGKVITGAQTAINLMPIWPPVHEGCRCEKWWPAGKMIPAAREDMN